MNRIARQSDITVNELDFLLHTSFRYCLGRKTYVTSECVELLLKYKHALHPHRHNQIVKEIKQYREMHGLAGMQCDDDEWQKVIDTFEGEK